MKEIVPEKEFCEVFIIMTDPSLREPLNVLTYYTNQQTKQLIQNALIVYIEGYLDDLLGELRKTLSETDINELEKIRQKLSKKRPILKTPFLK